MAFSINKITLLGNLGKDAEHKMSTNNNRISTFGLATTRSYKTKDDKYTDETTWHNCVAYSLSDFYVNLLKKGAKFYVDGRVSKRNYVDKEGVTKYINEVVVDKLIPLDSTNKNNAETVSETAMPAGAITDDDLPF